MEERDAQEVSQDSSTIRPGAGGNIFIKVVGGALQRRRNLVLKSSLITSNEMTMHNQVKP